MNARNYHWQLITADSVPFGDQTGWGLVAENLRKAAEHLEGLGYDIVSLQPVSPHFGFIFYRREKTAEDEG